MQDVKQRQLIAKETRRRRIAMGYLPAHKSKGIQNWYTTRELINRVNARIDSIGYCPINGKWQLQIRGKHLRRLLKAMPEIRNTGRKLVRK